MPLRNIKRKRFPGFGKVIYHAHKPRGNLLITEEGLKLRLRLGKLLNSVKLKLVDGREVVSFSKNVHPTKVGKGNHAILLKISPSDEAKFLSITERRLPVHLHSAVLKLYHLDNLLKGKPDGLTQYYANTMVSRWLMSQPKKRFKIVPLEVFGVSERVMGRRFIAAPTLEEARAVLIDKYDKEKKLGDALTNRQIESFLKRRRINLGGIDPAERDLHNDFYRGAKTNFGSPFEIVPDYTWKNIFVVGTMPDGTILFSIIDQSKKPIPELGPLLRKGMLFPQK